MLEWECLFASLSTSVYGCSSTRQLDGGPQLEFATFHTAGVFHNANGLDLVKLIIKLSNSLLKMKLQFSSKPLDGRISNPYIFVQHKTKVLNLPAEANRLCSLHVIDDHSMTTSF